MFRNYELEKTISFLNNEIDKFITEYSYFLISLGNNYRLDKISEEVYNNKESFSYICLANNIYEFYLTYEEFKITDSSNEINLECKKSILNNSVKIFYTKNGQVYGVNDNNGVFYNESGVSNGYLITGNVNDNKIYLKFKSPPDLNSYIKVYYKFYYDYEIYEEGKYIKIIDPKDILKYNSYIREISS